MPYFDSLGQASIFKSIYEHDPIVIAIIRQEPLFYQILLIESRAIASALISSALDFHDCPTTVTDQLKSLSDLCQKLLGSNLSQECKTLMSCRLLGCKKPKFLARRKPFESTCCRISHKNRAPKTVLISKRLVLIAIRALPVFA